MQSKLSFDEPFVVVPKSLYDAGLSPHAFMLLTYRWGKPKVWTDRNSDFKRLLDCGDHKLRSVLRELREAGYIEILSLGKDEKGQWKGKQRIWHRVSVSDKRKTDGSVAYVSDTDVCLVSNERSNNDDSKERSIPSSLRSDGQPPQINKKPKKASPANRRSSAKPKKKVAPKKKGKDPGLPYRLWEVWRDQVALHFDLAPALRPEPRHMHHLKHLGKKLHERISIRNGEAAHDDDVVHGFSIFCQGALQAADDWQERNFTPDILHSHFDRLLLAIRQKQMGSKKQRAEDAEWEALKAKWREQDRLEQQQQIQP